ncbi:MAG: hypothetical protein PHH77_12390 [Victivallaceae bacterium]|nr:hypothetical protein [Victivallaceae bacterium]
MKELTAEVSGKRIIFRSGLKGGAGKAFQAAGTAIPPTMRFEIKITAQIRNLLAQQISDIA